MGNAVFELFLRLFPTPLWNSSPLASGTLSLLFLFPRFLLFFTCSHSRCFRGVFVWPSPLLDALWANRLVSWKRLASSEFGSKWTWKPFHFYLIQYSLIFCIFSFLWVGLHFLDNNGHLYPAFLPSIETNLSNLPDLVHQSFLPRNCFSPFLPTYSSSQHWHMRSCTSWHSSVCWHIIQYYHLL